MLVLELKGFHSGDINNLLDWRPNCLSDVCFHLELDIGDIESDSSQFFQLLVATPEGLRKQITENKFYYQDRALLVIAEFNWDKILNKINSTLNICSKENWDESVLCLQKYFIWEYEDIIYV